MIKGRIVNVEIKKALCDSIQVPTLMYGSEALTWNEGSMITVEMHYLNGVSSGQNRMDGDSIENAMYGKTGTKTLEASKVFDLVCHATFFR